jgi:hypothetical protein
VVERGGLENRCVGNPCTEGSNPSLSARRPIDGFRRPAVGGSQSAADSGTTSSAVRGAGPGSISGIVQRGVLPRPASGVAYELTDYGQELRGAVTALLMWARRRSASHVPATP